MVKLITEGKDNSDAMLDALVKACKQVYGKEWDNKSEKEQRDIIMGFIKQAADNAKKSKKESMNTIRRSRRINESNGTINDLEFYIAQIHDTSDAIARLSDHATDIVNNYQEIEDDAGELRRTENDLLGFVKELQMWKEGFANYIGQMEEWVDNVLL